MKSKIALIIIIIFSLIWFAAGGTATYFGLEIINEARQSVNWPTVNGEIIKSEVVFSEDDDSTCYYAEVHYSYVIENQKYINDSINGAMIHCDKKLAYLHIKKYKKGQIVKVYYSPVNPEITRLEVGFNYGDLALAYFGGFFIICGLLSLTFIPDSKKNSYKPARDILYYHKQRARSVRTLFASLLLAYIISGLSFAFIQQIQNTLVVLAFMPMILFLFLALCFNIFSFVKNESWEAGIKGDIFWWNSPRFPRSKGEINLKEVKRITLWDNGTRAHVFLQNSVKKKKIPYVGISITLKHILEKHFNWIQVEYIESSS